MLAGCDLPQALDQSALVPPRTSDVGEIRSAEPGKFLGGFRKLDGFAAVSRNSRLLPTQTHNGIVLVDSDLQRLLSSAHKLGGNRFGKIDCLVGRKRSHAQHVLSRR